MQRINTPDGQFHAGDPSTGALGTIVTRDFMQSIQEELAGFVEGAGIQLDPASNAQLAKALSARLVANSPLADTGAVNAYAAANAVPLTAQTLIHGVRQRVKIATSNSGASTYSPDGLPPKPIVGLNLTALGGLELLAGQVAELEYVVAAAVNGGSGAWLLLRCGGGKAQLAAGSYGVTAPQFDYSTKMATTAAAINNGLRYPQSNGLGMVASGNIPLAYIGGWGQFGAVVTMTLPALSTVPAGATFTAMGGPTGGTIAANGTDVIVSSLGTSGPSATLIPGQQITFVSNGPAAGWYMASCGLGVGAFGSSLSGSSGYQKLPSGYIRQWGFGTLPASGSNVGAVVVTFPISFPNGVKSITASAIGAANSSSGYTPIMRCSAATNSQFQATGDLNGAATTFNQTALFYWQADGN